MKIVLKAALAIVLFLNCYDGFAQLKLNQVDSNGKKIGVWKKYYNNGRIRYSGQFKNGKEFGTFKFYSAASSKYPIVVKEYKPNGSADVQFFTQKGVLESKGVMIGKEREGKWLFYHEDGKTIMAEENYLNGKLHGPYVTYFNTGKITEEANYKNGKLDGVYKKYSIKGHQYQLLNYKEGKLNGKAVYYSRKTGDVVTKGQFLNDKRVGVWENYADGELVSTEQPNKKKPPLPKKKKKK